MKEWLDTHYPIHIPIIFMTLGLMLTLYVGETWLQPERESALKQVCPNLNEECLNKLAWESNPLYFLIPFGFTALGIIIGNSVRLLA